VFVGFTHGGTVSEWRAGAYYRGGGPAKPVVYEDFLPASAAAIVRTNLDTDTRAGAAAGAIGHHIHDPYRLYEKAAS
jgi:uncharacterized glyoxalase superfamily metalloenzyme YdcJ